jgi:hypothetical protein
MYIHVYVYVYVFVYVYLKSKPFFIAVNPFCVSLKGFSYQKRFSLYKK